MHTSNIKSECNAMKKAEKHKYKCSPIKKVIEEYVRVNISVLIICKMNNDE